MTSLTFGSNNQNQLSTGFSSLNNVSNSQVPSFGSGGSNFFVNNSSNLLNNTGIVATQPGSNSVFGTSSVNSFNNQNTLNSTTSNNLFGNQPGGSFFSGQNGSSNLTSGFNFNSTVSTQNSSSNTPSGLSTEISTSNGLSAFGSISSSNSFTLGSTSNTFFPSQNTPTISSNMLNNPNTLQPKLNFGNNANPSINTLSFSGSQQTTQPNISGIGFGSIQATNSFSIQSSNSSVTSSTPLLNNLQNTPGSFSSIQSSFTTQVTTVNQSSSNNSAQFALGSTISTPILSSIATKPAASSPFTLNTNLPVSSTISQSTFTVTSTGLGGISNIKPIQNNASPLAVSSISSKKGLGGSPISDSSRSVLSKDATQKISMINQVKDMELPPELKETVENFKKFVAEQKKMREEIIKSNDSSNLMTRVEEESQMLRQSISEVANGLQKVQIQSNRLRCDIAKEQSSIKIVQSVSESSTNVSTNHGESSKYFANKVRDMENRASLYLQEIDAVESMCNSTSKSALTSRDLVDIIRKMDDEFIGLAAKMYMVHERVKVAKAEYLRHLRQNNKHHNPFLAIEGRFGDTQNSTGGNSSCNNRYRMSNVATTNSSSLSSNDCVGSSPFDTSCYMKLSGIKSFTSPQAGPLIKPSIFGANTNNNNQTAVVLAGAPNQTFSFSGSPSPFGLNKPTNLFMTETEVSNKKRR